MLERLAQELLDRESLDGHEIYQLIEEMTGEDLMPASLKQKLLDDAARAEAKDEDRPDATEPEEEDPHLGGESLPSPATP